jgi:hypothetical protein
MPTYRVYRLDRNDRVIGPPVPVEAADDGDAVQAGKLVAAQQAFEIWHGPRLVARGSPVGTEPKQQS